MFLNNPDVKLDPEHGWPLILQDELRYTHPAWGDIVVPIGYRTDLASVPRLFWRIVPPFGRYSRAAIVHDWLCSKGRAGAPHNGMSSADAHRVFRDAMKELGVVGWRRYAMFRAVRIAGPRWSATR